MVGNGASGATIRSQNCSVVRSTPGPVARAAEADDERDDGHAQRRRGTRIEVRRGVGDDGDSAHEAPPALRSADDTVRPSGVRMARQPVATRPWGAPLMRYSTDRRRPSGMSATTRARPVAMRIPSMPRQSAATPPMRLPTIWPSGEEDRVQAHDRPAVGGERLGDVGQHPERRRRRPGQDEQAADDDHSGGDPDEHRDVFAVVDHGDRGDHQHRPPGSRRRGSSSGAWCGTARPSSRGRRRTRPPPRAGRR